MPERERERDLLKRFGSMCINSSQIKFNLSSELKTKVVCTLKE